MSCPSDKPPFDYGLHEMVKITLSDVLPASSDIWLEPGTLGGPRGATPSGGLSFLGTPPQPFRGTIL